MDQKKFFSFLKKTVSYVLVAALASAGTWFAADKIPNSKLERLSSVIENRFIGQSDKTRMEDVAAAAMIASLGDRWSYYISAQDYAAHLERQDNAYVGVGVTIQQRQDGLGVDIVDVVEGGPAQEAGIVPGDILTHADGTELGALTITEVRNLVMGEKNTQVVLTILRDGKSMEIPVTRKTVHSPAATGRMLEAGVGYIAIDNFHNGAGKQTIEEIEKLMEQGAQKLIFDVRDNPGGYVDEMVKLLDYLLPEGPLFRSVSSDGWEDLDESDAACLQLPMAVLINGNSYSAAEFFAAALSEYNWATTVGEPTVGKGYYQITIELGDGSAVQLSTGAYTTPNGVNLTEVGGLKPDVEVTLTEVVTSWEEDPQIQAAILALAEETE